MMLHIGRSAQEGWALASGLPSPLTPTPSGDGGEGEGESESKTDSAVIEPPSSSSSSPSLLPVTCAEDLMTLKLLTQRRAVAMANGGQQLRAVVVEE